MSQSEIQLKLYFKKITKLKDHEKTSSNHFKFDVLTSKSCFCPQEDQELFFTRNK